MFNMIDQLFRLIPDVLLTTNLDYIVAVYLGLFINFVLLCILSYLIFLISRRIVARLMTFLAAKTSTKFDDFLILNQTPKYLAYLIPFLFVFHSVPVILKGFVYYDSFFNKAGRIYIIFLLLWIIRSALNALSDYLKQKTKYNDKPIDSYIQVVMIVLWLFGFVTIIFRIFDIGMTALFGTLGAASAVILLIFKDTILGFVASVQVSLNDMVRIGDWITFDKFGADGNVVEINLATVKVRNFDNTTTTIPTYSLISDSFRNWRGMLDSEGRRIKRHISIKSSSIHFLQDDELENLKKIQLIADFIDARQKEIWEYNRLKKADKSLIINGRNMTNFGIYREYITKYLQHHPGLNKDMTLMCRQLQSTGQGVPLEIYTFSTDKRWENYEHTMADVFDHIIAAAPFFGLEIFELPSQGNHIFRDDQSSA